MPVTNFFHTFVMSYLLVLNEPKIRKQSQWQSQLQ